MNNEITILNKIIYDNLTGILKQLNKRIHIKLYSLVYDKENKNIKNIRVKKTVATEKSPSSISQDGIKKLTNVFAELKIKPILNGDICTDIQKYVNGIWYNQNLQLDTSNDGKSLTLLTDPDGAYIVNEEIQLNETRILYANQIPFQVDEDNYSVIYIIEMRNVEQESRELFYTKPELSFLRMVLDCFFMDFFALTNSYIKINKQYSIALKYNEDSVQFNRRLTRLFFGKLQNYLSTNTTANMFGENFEHDILNQYYVNNLLEKIDDISTLTYENSSPFGSILFLNKDVISQQTIIHFTVKFTKEDRIGLEDAKRIRKLLELTNVDKDLYLIADANEIYGLGEVNWNVQKGALALRLDFNGLSKYKLVLVRTEAELISRGKLFVEDKRKFYRSDLSLFETNLVSVSFKNPRIGEEGYSSEKFKNLLKKIFWENKEDYSILRNMEILDNIVRNAREQKQGTMVVITEPMTAKKEMKQLSKQSTIIEPRIINPEYIKFLTAIDGAIYFDIDGNCYAIGVILDGVAKEKIGDSSRGARYNSAQRYLYKLKDDEQKKCIIVIISEDGMVDLIPELEHEDMLLTVAEEIIDMISEKDFDTKTMKEKEDLLLKSKIVDCDWLFKIGNVYLHSNIEFNQRIEKAIEFFKSGVRLVENDYMKNKYYSQLGQCYFEIEDYKEAIQMYDLAIRNSDNYNDQSIFLQKLGLSYFSLAIKLDDDTERTENLEQAIKWYSKNIELIATHSLEPSVKNYNTRGRSYLVLSRTKKYSKQKEILLNNAIEDFNQSLELNPKDPAFYWNRHLCYQKLEKMECAIKDLIYAEYLKHDDKYTTELTEIFENHLDLVTESFEFYEEEVKQKEESSQLRELFAIYIEKTEMNIKNEVAADKAHNISDAEN